MKKWWNGFRLRTKLNLSIAAIPLSLFLEVVIALSLALFLPKDGISSTGSIVIFAAIFTPLGYMFWKGLKGSERYQNELQEAWWAHVRANGVNTLRALEVMQNNSPGDEQYREADFYLLDDLAVAPRRLNDLLVSENPERIFKLIGQGWIRLSLVRDENVPVPFLELTDQGEGVFDELMPKDWSPEDRQENVLGLPDITHVYDP